MSVTYVALNLDKHEYVNPHGFGEGGKDYECMTNTFGVALFWLLQPPGGLGDFFGHWHGDRIQVVNDYCEKHDFEEWKAGRYPEDHGAAKDISYEVMLEVDEWCNDIIPDWKQDHARSRAEVERRRVARERWLRKGKK
jgi:hypothetical protein